MGEDRMTGKRYYPMSWSLEESQPNKTSAQISLHIILQPVHSINIFLVRHSSSFLKTQEAGAEGLSQVQGQPGMSSKFQVSQDTMLSPCLRGKKKRHFLGGVVLGYGYEILLIGSCVLNISSPVVGPILRGCRACNANGRL